MAKTVQVTPSTVTEDGEAFAAILDNGNVRIGYTGLMCKDIPATHAAHRTIALAVESAVGSEIIERIMQNHNL